MKEPTSEPYRTHVDMPLVPWLRRFWLMYLRSRWGQARRRWYCWRERPRAESIRFDVFGGKSPYVRQCIPLSEAIAHLSKGKRVQINSRLPSGRHALMLDWDERPEADVRAWLANMGGRWHLYRTDRGFHFICSSRTVGYWETVRFHYRSKFHENVGVHVSIWYGHFALRVSCKQPGRRDKIKLGVVGEGEEITEVLDLIAAHDEALERLSQVED